MDNWLYLLLPLSSTLLGWVGLRMVSSLMLSRALASKKPQLAHQLGQFAAAAFSLDTLQQKVNNPENVKKIMPVVETHIDDFLRNKLKAKMPVVGMLIGEKTIHSLKEVFLKEIEDLFPQVLSKFTGNLADEIDIAGLVTARINAVPDASILKNMSPVVRLVGVAGALVGLVIGLVNLMLVWLLR